MKARPASLWLARLPHVSWARLLATLMLTAAVLAVAVDIALWAGQRFRPPPVSFIQGQSVFVAEMFYAVAYAGMGWLLATRVSRNPLGWIFLVLGASMSTQLSITFVVQQGHETFRQLDPAVHLAAWFASSVHLPSVVLLNVLVFLLFPTGRPLSARWGLAGWIAGAGTLLVILGVGLSPEGIAWYPSLANPLAAPMAMRLPLAATTITGLALMVLGVLIATASMVARYRRASSDQRAQLRWIAVAVLALSVTGLPFIVVRYGLQADYASGHLLLATALVAGCFLPLAAAVAVLRYRLYDIDVIINRALVYIPLTAILGGMYTGGVALAQRVFVAITNERSDAAIVITTLVVASMFTHLKNALQGFVDQRFKPARATVMPELPELIPAEELKARLHQLEQRLAAIEQDASRRR